MAGVLATLTSAGSSGRLHTRPILWPPLVAGALCLLMIALQLRFDLNLMDEGFLWYGAQRVVAGELPLRDFQAYDPGRYFWSASWMALVGDNGILALRAGNALLSAITVIMAVWIVGSSSPSRSPAAMLGSGVIFTLWMVPGFKASDAFAVVLLLLGLTRLLRQPMSIRYFQAGVCWGVTAMIGINHALYGAIACLLTFIYLRGAPKPAASLAASSLGAIIGYAPVLALHLLAPGFSAAFIDSIRMIFEAGITNFPLPFPSLFAAFEILRHPRTASAEVAFAMLFLCVPLLWAAMLWRLNRRKFRGSLPPESKAALFVSVPYAHYAYSRADPAHVAISILPVLIIVLTFALQASRGRRRLMLTSIFTISLLMTAQMHPAYVQLRGIYLNESVNIAGDLLIVSPDTAAVVRIVKAVANAAGPNPFFAGPYLPGAYALAKRRSPTWENYMIFPASRRRQVAEVARLRSADIDYAIIRQVKWDGRPDLGLSGTHPLVLAYLEICLPKSRLIPLGTSPLIIRMKADPGACKQSNKRKHSQSASSPAARVAHT